MKTLKLRIYPNREQKIQIEKTIGCCRFIYNRSLERRIKHYQETQTVLHKYELIAEIAQLKKQKEFVWLKEVNAQSLQQSIIRLDKAFVAFFRKTAKFPKFKSKKNPVNSFDVPQHYEVSYAGKTVKLPKIGVLRFRDKLNYKNYGEIRTVTVVRERNQYYVCVVCESTKADSVEPVRFENSVGIDLGIKTFATLSNGQKINLPKLSKNTSKAARQRRDFLHKLSTRLVDNQDWRTLVVEDMRVSGMVSSITNINRATFSQGWRMFIEMLRYKCEEKGKNFVTISCFEAASRMCVCGKKKAELTPTERSWSCSCGLTHDRDVLAAKNIRKFGTGNCTVSAGTPHECISKPHSL